MTSDTVTRLAQTIGACRRAATASGHGIRVVELEVLLLIAGGADASADLVAATGSSKSHIKRALRFLSGRDAGYDPGGTKAIRSSPFQLIEYRAHPHRRGFQWRLSEEGKSLLAPCLHLNHRPD